jgi:signal transduction histidine kinase
VLSALPIRLRLTLPFALAMAVVLAGLGAFVYLRVGAALIRSTDQQLVAEATEANLRLAAGRPLLDRDATGRADMAQVLARNGKVLSSDPLGLPPLLPARLETKVFTGRSLYDSTTIAGELGRWRLYAIPVSVHGADEALVLGGSLRAHDESLEGLRHELLFALPLALLVATLAGYSLAGAALRPVEAMRRRAGAISAATPGTRLPVPRATDEMSRLAVTLNEMLARLETAFEHERRFIAEASHELRTPLALLRTELELALRKPRSREDLEEALRSAAEETERLTALAADLLLIARADENAMQIHPTLLPAAALLETVAERFALRVSELGRELIVSCDPDLKCDADVRRVEQALANLIENALLHGAGPVALSARRVAAGVELHVADQGVGFPQEFAPRAFDRFSRADDSRSKSGSGLGLAIVRAIAKAHEGGVGIATAEPHGADVWILLPSLTQDERSREPLAGRFRRGRAGVGASASRSHERETR